jgi:hypothetical protein
VNFSTPTLLNPQSCELNYMPHVPVHLRTNTKLRERTHYRGPLERYSPTDPLTLSSGDEQLRKTYSSSTSNENPEAWGNVDAYLCERDEEVM